MLNSILLNFISKRNFFLNNLKHKSKIQNANKSHKIRPATINIEIDKYINIIIQSHYNARQQNKYIFLPQFNMKASHQSFITNEF